MSTKLARRAIATACTAAAVSVGAIALADPAVAASGCTAGACVDVATGGKNYSNHTQWVSTIHVSANLSDQGGDLQAWTYQYYNAISSVRGYTFTVNKWVPSGNNVCGAVQYGPNRAIACITIRV